MPARENRPGLSTDASLVADLLKLLLKIRAKESGVAPRLIARGEDLDALAAGKRTGLALLEGWRFEQFGADALALVEGRLGFSVVGGRLRMQALEARPASAGEASAPAETPAPDSDAAAPRARRRAPPRRAKG